LQPPAATLLICVHSVFCASLLPYKYWGIPSRAKPNYTDKAKWAKLLRCLICVKGSYPNQVPRAHLLQGQNPYAWFTQAFTLRMIYAGIHTHLWGGVLIECPPRISLFFFKSLCHNCCGFTHPNGPFYFPPLNHWLSSNLCSTSICFAGIVGPIFIWSMTNFDKGMVKRI